MAEHNDFGKQGENLAVEFLKQKGYQILASNWHYGNKEIDIIASCGDEIVFFEVKTRTSTFVGEPYMAVNRTKQKNIIVAANAYIQQKNINLDARFDIISIVIRNGKPQIEHLERAFYPTMK